MFKNPMAILRSRNIITSLVLISVVLVVLWLAPSPYAHTYEGYVEKQQQNGSPIGAVELVANDFYKAKQRRDEAQAAVDKAGKNVSPKQNQNLKEAERAFISVNNDFQNLKKKLDEQQAAFIIGGQPKKGLSSQAINGPSIQVIKATGPAPSALTAVAVPYSVQGTVQKVGAPPGFREQEVADAEKRKKVQEERGKTPSPSPGSQSYGKPPSPGSQPSAQSLQAMLQLAEKQMLSGNQPSRQGAQSAVIAGSLFGKLF